jgi:sulfate transport system permease protein
MNPARLGNTLLRRRGVLPGFGVGLGLTLFYAGLLVLLPLSALVLKASSLGLADTFRLATDDRTLAALKLTFGAAAVAGIVNAVFGVLVAWVRCCRPPTSREATRRCKWWTDWTPT